MPARTVRRLYDLEIDEVSLVDRPANEHGRVAIAKRAEAPRMNLIDANGDPVTEDELEPGEYATDSDTGEVYYMASPEEVEALTAQGIDLDEPEVEETEEEPERELAGVGKARSGAYGNVPALNRIGRRKNQKGGVGKSLGQQVLEELSKAFDDGDRDQVISKLAERIDESDRRAARAEAIAKALADQAEARDYERLAAGYDVPIDPSRLGTILRKVSKTLSDDELGDLDRVLSASQVGFEELGYSGGADASVHDQISALARDTVSKSGGLTVEQATVALYEANPEAYDQYCAGI